MVIYTKDTAVFSAINQDLNQQCWCFRIL